MKTQKNNFDALRLLGALLVALGHSMDVLVGYDWLGRATNVQSLGGVGLNIFCVISGYLITQSRARNSASDFARSRVLRIFPALFVAVPIMAFVMGPLVTTSRTGAYLTAAETWRFVASAFAIPLNPSLPGVFGGAGVIGQLYSLTAELLFYGFACAIGGWKRFPIVVGVLLVAVWSVFIAANYTSLPFDKIFLLQVSHLIVFFFPVRLCTLCIFYLLMGSMLAIVSFETHILQTHILEMLIPGLLTIWMVALVSKDRHSYDMVEMMLFPLLVLGIGTTKAFVVRIPNFLGDMSYGIYIYHFAIAELLSTWGGTRWRNGYGVVLALGLSLLVGWASFHLVEKRALAYKTWRARKAVAEVSVAARAVDETAAAS